MMLRNAGVGLASEQAQRLMYERRLAAMQSEMLEVRVLTVLYMPF